jgi:hypothetical protein
MNSLNKTAISAYICLIPILYNINSSSINQQIFYQLSRFLFLLPLSNHFLFRDVNSDLSYVKRQLKFIQWPSSRHCCPNTLVNVVIFFEMYFDLARARAFAVVHLLGMCPNYLDELTNDDIFMPDLSCKRIPIKQ